MSAYDLSLKEGMYLANALYKGVYPQAVVLQGGLSISLQDRLLDMVSMQIERLTRMLAGDKSGKAVESVLPKKSPKKEDNISAKDVEKMMRLS